MDEHTVSKEGGWEGEGRWEEKGGGGHTLSSLDPEALEVLDLAKDLPSQSMVHSVPSVLVLNLVRVSEW
jgi:hypothetical protein